MTASVAEVVREHIRTSRKFRQSVNGNPAKARAFLIKAGILAKSGKKLAKRFR